MKTKQTTGFRRIIIAFLPLMTTHRFSGGFSWGYLVGDWCILLKNTWLPSTWRRSCGTVFSRRIWPRACLSQIGCQTDLGMRSHIPGYEIPGELYRPGKGFARSSMKTVTITCSSLIHPNNRFHTGCRNKLNSRARDALSTSSLQGFLLSGLVGWLLRWMMARYQS